MGAKAAASPPVGGSREACSLARHLLESTFRLEEELLFPAIESRMNPGSPPATAALRSEHRKIEALLEHAATNRAARSDVVTDAVALARLHIRREEETLFPLARRLLGPGHLEQLGRTWAEARASRVETLQA